MVSRFSTAPAVDARGLVKTYGEHRALDGVDLLVEGGSVHAVLGPNGAGKTTTVKILATLLRPDAGTARVYGRDVVKDPAAVRHLIGLTGQYASVDNSLTALENLVIFARLLDVSRPRRRAWELLERFDLSSAARRPVSGFSGGMRRRLDIAASMLQRPWLIFLDEPTTGLDPRTRNSMWDTVRALVADGVTVVLTTQYLEEADQLAGMLTVINHGRVVAEGTPEQLKSAVGSSTMVVVLKNPALWAQARDAVRPFTRYEPYVDRETGRLTLPVPDASLVPNVVWRLSQRRIGVAEIAVHRPTLDDVFFALTETGEREISHV